MPKLMTMLPLHAVASTIAVACGLLVSASLPAQTTGAGARDWSQVLAAAKKEGLVRFYSAQPVHVLDQTVAGFRKAYPEINIEHARGNTSMLLSRIDRERQSGADGADVWLTTEFGWFRARAREGKLVRLSGPAFHNWPPEYIAENGHFVIVGLEPFVIPYNKALLGGAAIPKGYGDLLRPEYKGRLGTTELAATVLIAWYDWLEKTQGTEYLPKLKAQTSKLYNGSQQIAQALAAGEIALSAFGVPSAMRPLMDQGAPVDFVVPVPAMWTQYGVAVLEWSKRPAAGTVLADYIMSREGQRLWHGRGESASPLPDVPGSLRASAGTPWNADAYPPEVVAQYRERWMKIFR